MSGSARILLIDDDLKLTRLLSGYLEGQGFSMSCAHDGLAGLTLARDHEWDAVILDGMLPRLDGLDVLRRLRQVSRVPVLMLTARGDEADCIQGLETGADDYLPKTVSPRQLTARLRALLRRAKGDEAPAPKTLDLGELSLAAEARQATLRGQPLALTPLEFDLLLALARNRGRVCSREQLVAQLRDRAFDAHDRSIDVHVTALRRKLGDDPRDPRYLRTVRGAGYLLQAPPRS